MGSLKRMPNEERGLLPMILDAKYDVGPVWILTILCCCSHPVVTWEETEHRQWDPSLLKRVFSSLLLLFRARAPNSCNFNSIFLFPSTNTEVCSTIDRLKTKKAQRYTGVKTKFIKYCKLILSPIISNLFNLCIETGVFLNCLKIAEVIPIYKKGDQNMPTNYRPISLLSQFDKIFEKMLFSKLFSYLDKINF